jgi:hypothetical protein
VHGGLILGPFAADEASNVVSLIEVVVPDGIASGRMRSDKCGMDEKGLIPVFFQPLRHCLAHE